MKVRYSRRALAQIAEISAAIAEEAPGIASRFSQRIETLAALLARHPAIGRRTDLAGIRVFAIRPHPYLLFYREEAADGGGVTVLRVRHMAREEDWRTGH